MTAGGESTEAAPAPQRARASVAAGAALWAVVFGLTWWLLLQRFVIVRDEAWALWVATRLARGESLYHGVYDVTTPLPAWLAGLAVRVTGPQLATMRALLAAIFATQTLFGLAVVRRAGLGRVGRAVFVIAMLAVAAPFGAFVSLYSALAVAAAMGTVWATMVWLDTAGPGGRVDGAAAWIVGVAGGVAFWSKPNVGVLCALAVLAALVAAMWGEPWRRWLPGIGRVAAGALAVSVGCSVVIMATGALPSFVDQVFRSKGEYVGLGFSYSTAVRSRYQLLTSSDGPVELRRITELAVQLAPAVLALGAVVGALRARRATRWSRVGFAAFGVVAVASIFPRPGLNHITGVMPLLVTAVTGAWAIGNRMDRPAARATLARVAAVTLGAVACIAMCSVAVPLLSPADAEAFRRDARHFSWTSLAKRQAGASSNLRRDLAERGIDSIFIVRKDAGFLYLRAGVDNPLPYDIVERSDLGGDDEVGVIRRLREGEADWVCVRRPGSGGIADADLVPRRLERWIRTHFRPESRIARCDLYRAP